VPTPLLVGRVSNPSGAPGRVGNPSYGEGRGRGKGGNPRPRETLWFCRDTSGIMPPSAPGDRPRNGPARGTGQRPGPTG